MKAVIQRVNSSSVYIEGKESSAINKGLLVLLGVEHDDNDLDISYMVDKISNMRIFEDENYKMNLSVQDVGGEILVVSQFTLLADCRKGRRPSFDNAARPEQAKAIYEKFIAECIKRNLNIKTGTFQAEMTVNIENHGPVTILLDSKKNF